MNTSLSSRSVQSDSGIKPLWAFAWLLAGMVFIFVAVRSPGFDDEIFNIDLIEHLGTLGTARLAQTEDVHPPGGYLVNGILFQLTGSWPRVRAVSAVLYIGSSFLFVAFLRRRYGQEAAALAFGLGVLSPAALIWCTSIRWYAYFLPLLLWGLIIPESAESRWARWKPAVVWFLLASIGYAAIVILPAFIGWWYVHRKTRLKSFALQAALPWGLAFVLYLPQLHILLTVHAPNSVGQTFGLFKSLEGLAVSMASNQGLFPLSAMGIASAVGWVGIYGFLARLCWLRKIDATPFILLCVAVVCMVASGLSGKFRNLVILMPFQAAAVATLAGCGRKTIPLIAVIALALLTTLAGIVNVARHDDTTKNSWNVPVDDIVDASGKLAAACGAKANLFTYDPLVWFRARQRHPDWPIFSYYSRFDNGAISAAPCIVMIITYRGALTGSSFANLKNTMATMNRDGLQQVFVGHDPNAALKKKLDPDYPDSQAEILLFRHTENEHGLEDWIRSRPPPGAPVKPSAPP